MSQNNKNMYVRYMINYEIIEESFSKERKVCDICSNVGQVLKTNSIGPVYLGSEEERGARKMKAKAGQIALIILLVIGIILMGIDVRLLSCSSFPDWMLVVFILSMAMNLVTVILIYKFLK